LPRSRNDSEYELLDIGNRPVMAALRSGGVSGW
jgi:hypothetical protein